ncbi:glyoxalase/bleomycin resistance/extradiol dioxygenase family protein [Phenylobacterium sp. J367]|uniref:VOC family protein n=1 Tax=Phenylobacterium sp. J367 TaxID=2898435 RepID=UPI0021508421|nr:glyoxalase/bleomycin resistance/extradiol dioxygenase family protein [Phenylobacterium sp. J367]MCR5881019.1 glyoxalase/bleomycin resistance/extradiol dioxygenase family protein [Phenylobacterium sp. J367]
MSDTLEAAPEAAAQVPVKGGLVTYLNVDGAKAAAEFYVKAFGAEIASIIPPDEQGRTMHAHVYINGGSLMLSDFYPEHGFEKVAPQAFSVMIMIPDDDIQGWWKRAIDAGCTGKVEPQVMFWGDTYGELVDPYGVTWAMNQPKR